MASSDPITSLGLSCPFGGNFYICQNQNTQFLGCCTSNPCTDAAKGVCPQANLRYASFDANFYDNITAQACPASGSLWYTCTQGIDNHPFMGCCTLNACGSQRGCGSGNVRAAVLSDDEESAAVFETASGFATSSTSSSSRSSSTTTASATTSSVGAPATVTTTVTPTAVVAPVGNDDKDTTAGLSAGAKAGIGIGCVAVVALVAAVLFLVMRRYMKKHKGVVVEGAYPSSSSYAGSPMGQSEYHFGKYFFPSSLCPFHFLTLTFCFFFFLRHARSKPNHAHPSRTPLQPLLCKHARRRQTSSSSRRLRAVHVLGLFIAHHAPPVGPEQHVAAQTHIVATQQLHGVDNNGQDTVAILVPDAQLKVGEARLSLFVLWWSGAAQWW